MVAMSSKALSVVVVVVVVIALFGVRMAQGYNHIVGSEYVSFGDLQENTSSKIVNAWSYDMARELRINDPYDWNNNAIDIRCNPDYNPYTYIQDMNYFPVESQGSYYPKTDGFGLYFTSHFFPDAYGVFGPTPASDYIGVSWWAHIIFNVTLQQVLSGNQSIMTFNIEDIAPYSTLRGVQFYWQKMSNVPIPGAYNNSDPIFYHPYYATEYSWPGSSNIWRYTSALHNNKSATVDLNYNVTSGYSITESAALVGNNAYLVMGIEIDGSIVESGYGNWNVSFSQKLYKHYSIDLEITGITGNYVWAMSSAIPTMGVISGLAMLGGSMLILANTPSYSTKRVVMNRSVIRPISTYSPPPQEVVDDMAFDYVKQGGF
jgi:hypothetical protein